MLTATGGTTFGSATVRSAVFFDQRFWAYVIDRRLLRFDSSFMPRPERSSKTVLLYFIVEGTFTIEGRDPPFTGPTTLALTEDDFEGAGKKPPVRFVAEGESYVALDLRLDRRDVLCDVASPMPLTVPSTAWTAARAVVAARELSASVVAMRSLFESLEHARLVRAGLAAGITEGDPRFARLWTGAAPLISNYEALPSLKEVALRSGLSMRHIAREVHTFLKSFGVLGSKWREVTRRSRLKLAVLGLSAVDASVADVARASGYGSTDAMARAFRDAGLPAPSAVQAAVRPAIS